MAAAARPSLAATITDAALTVNKPAVAAVEGQSFSGTVATFSDPGGGAGSTASIAWGDGTTTSGTVSGTNVLGSHSYAEEGSYSVSVQLFDDGGSTATATGTATVADAAPAVTAGSPLNTVEGQSFSGTVATFSDPGGDAATYTASIAWGDGSTTSGTVSGGSVLGQHSYDEGTFTIVVTVFDDGGGTGSAAVSADRRSDAPLTATGLSLAATEGQSFSGTVATFSDPGGDAASYTASIAWGDGSTTSGTVSGTNILGSHSYAEEGNYPFTVTLFDDGGSSVTVTGTATVADAAVAVSGLTVTVLEGQTFSGAVASVSDPGTDAATYTASIAWGDGSTTSGTVSGSSLLGQHNYADEGTYTVSVQVFDEGGSTATAVSSVSVVPASLSLAALAPVEGQAVSGVVATFSDAGGDGDTFTALIVWGDGSSDAATFSGSSLLGSHTYADEGTYTLTVQLTNNSGVTVSTAAALAVADAALTLTATSPLNAVEQQSFSGTVATFSDPGNDAASYTASLDWGDGSTTSGTVSGSSILGNHSYADEGSFTVTVRLFDDGGSSRHAGPDGRSGRRAAVGHGATAEHGGGTDLLRRGRFLR